MDAEEIKNFKNAINQSIKDISSKIVDLNVDSDGDECDVMQASVILDIAYAEKNRNTFKLRNMIAALHKINNNEYGYCEECGEEIAIKRLQIFPDAKYCIFCAEKIEKDIGKIL